MAKGLARAAVFLVAAICPSAGEDTCACLPSLEAFGIDVTEGLVVQTSSGMQTYPPTYGVGNCSAHDRGLPPVCDTPSAPAWCSQHWCYVNATTCGAAGFELVPSEYLAHHSRGSEVMLSYSVCSERNLWTEWSQVFAGTIKLCSVIKEIDGIPCGNTAAVLQVEAMVETINSLTSGLGFSVLSGNPASPSYYRFSFQHETYPEGAWETVGRSRAEALFPQCDVIVGQGHGCGATGDDEIKSQAAVAHSHQRLYFTQRGPRQVLSNPDDPSSRLSPYMFSTHIRSDEYSHVVLRQIAQTARSEESEPLKLAVLNFAHNAFFDGVATETVAYAAEHADLYTVVYSANLKSPSDGLGPVCEPFGEPTGAPGCASLSEYLDAVVSSSPDVLLVSSNGDAFKQVLYYLSEQRPRVDRGEIKRKTTALAALFWVGVPWLQNGEPACAGLRSHCSHAIGATQISPEEANMYVDQLLLSAGVPATYDWLRENNTALAAAYAVNVTKAEADAAVIPSIIAQAMQKVFRYRMPESREFPLRQASSDYEALRTYIGSGEVIARTYYGPVSFDDFGNNAGRSASVFQAQPDGSVVTTFPATLTGSRPHRYPVPAVESAPLGTGAYELDYGLSCASNSDGVLPPCGENEGGPSCLLCKPVSYDEHFPFEWALVAVIAGSSLLLLLSLGVLFAKHKVRKAKEEVEVEAAEREEAERRKKLLAEEKAERRTQEIMKKEEWEVQEAIDTALTLQHSAAMLPADKFIELGRLVSYEELRNAGKLRYLDSIEELLVLKEKMIFISHQWTGNLQPDQQFTVEEACRMRVGPNDRSSYIEPAQNGQVDKAEEIIVLEEQDDFFKVRKKSRDMHVVGWLSRTNEKGEAVIVEHHKQFAAMVNGVCQICEAHQWALDQVLIWVDYSSIPQANDAEKGGAIAALPAYASCTDALLIAAPKIRHTNGDYECNLQTYRDRMWCRAEQLFFVLRNGKGAIYITEGKEPQDFQTADMEKERVREHIDVFSSSAIATDETDKKLLVRPLLGLYACMLRDNNDEQRQIFGRAEDFFPKTVVIRNILKNGVRTPVPVEKQKEEALFGNLLEAVPRTVKMLESGEMHKVEGLAVIQRRSMRSRALSMDNDHNANADPHADTDADTDTDTDAEEALPPGERP
jgi:hypothetical protein|eukprot:COSAG06_NODE_3600_length_5134_cov_15.959881_4_plen_1151_part_00